MFRAASKNASTLAGRHAKPLDQQPREVLAVEGGREREHRVVEADVLQLHDRVGDFAAPIAAAALDHADGKAVQRDVEDVPAAAAEPGGQPAQLVVLFGQQHGAAGAGQRVGGRHAAQPAADHDDVVAGHGDSARGSSSIAGKWCGNWHRPGQQTSFTRPDFPSGRRNRSTTRRMIAASEPRRKAPREERQVSREPRPLQIV